MSQANHRPVPGYEGGFVRPDPVRDLAAYDQLPADVRRALDEAPFAISAREALTVYKKSGHAAVMREIAESAALYYEACEAQTGVPRPEGELVRRKVVRLYR